MEYLIFHLNSYYFGIPLDQTREIIPAIESAPVPSINKAFESVVQIRGHQVPVLNLSQILNVEQDETKNKKNVLMLMLDKKIMAAYVDSVVEIQDISDDEIDRVKSVSGDQDLNHRYIRGVCKKKDYVISVINMNGCAE